MHINPDFIYPVGSIYMNVNNVNPAVLFGGTWEQLKDRFLLGAGNTYKNGATGGEATHKLTVNEMPKHNHIIRFSPGNNGAGSTGVLATQGVQTTSSDTGGDQAHNNMPPYLVVYMWKRTA